MDRGVEILLDEILKEQRETRGDIKVLSDTVSQLQLVNAEKKGERRVVVWLAAAVSGLVAFVVEFLR